MYVCVYCYGGSLTAGLDVNSSTSQRKPDVMATSVQPYEAFHPSICWEQWGTYLIYLTILDHWFAHIFKISIPVLSPKGTDMERLTIGTLTGRFKLLRRDHLSLRHQYSNAYMLLRYTVASSDTKKVPLY